jgi:NAD+ kinase
MTVFEPPGAAALCYHPAVAGAAALAGTLAAQLRAAGVEAWVDALPSPDDALDGDRFRGRLEGVGLLVCVGGDGTVLHASEYAARGDTPIFGVRMGRLGFLTETVEEEAAADLARVLAGQGRLERRCMVQATVGESPPLHALNDIVIGRGTLGQTVSIGARIDGVLVAEYRADAVVVSTATGSTGYSLSAGGPILHPNATELVLVPVAPHLTRANPLVLPGDTRLRLTVERGYEAVITADGLHRRPVEAGTVVEVTRSPLTAEFVRLGGESQFYANLAKRLGWLRTDHVLDESAE